MFAFRNAETCRNLRSMPLEHVLCSYPRYGWLSIFHSSSSFIAVDNHAASCCHPLRPAFCPSSLPFLSFPFPSLPPPPSSPFVHGLWLTCHPYAFERTSLADRCVHPRVRARARQNAAWVPCGICSLVVMMRSSAAGSTNPLSMTFRRVPRSTYSSSKVSVVVHESSPNTFVCVFFFLLNETFAKIHFYFGID